jgi:DnaA family protein
MFVQIPLKMGLRDTATFDNFVVEDESTAMGVVSLQTSLTNAKGDAYFLLGSNGVGKTHLLQSACRQATEQNQSSVYLPLADESLPLIPDVLNGLEHTKVVCLDDVDSVTGHEDWEVALENLIIKAATQGNVVIMAGGVAMQDWNLAHTNLLKALMTVIPISLKPLKQKHEMKVAMQKHSRSLGFEVPDQVADYLIKNHAEGLSDLMQLLKILEDATLVQKRRLTLQFVKTIL